MTDFKVPPGSTLNVDLRRRRKPKAQAPANITADDSGILASDDEPTRYVFRDQGITFFDFGVRRQEGGGWAYAPASLRLDVVIDGGNAAVAAWNAAFLSDLDPFPVCLKLSANAENLFTDLVFSSEDEEDKRYIVGRGGERGYLIDYPEEGDAEPEPREQQEWRQGSLVPKLNGSSTARLESAWYYNSFDTSSAPGNYKVTREPDPAAEAVQLTFGRQGRAEIYLTPKMGPFVGTSSAAVARAPVLPAPDAYADRFTFIQRFGTAEMHGRAPSSLWDAHFALLRAEGLTEEEWPSDTNVTLLSDAPWVLAGVASAGVAPLAALVRRGGVLYYVWGVMQGGLGTPPFHQLQMFNPWV